MYLEIINHKLQQLEPEDVLSKNFGGDIYSTARLQEEFHEGPKWGESVLQFTYKNSINNCLGFEVRREKSFQGNEALKDFSPLLHPSYLEHGFQQLLISKLSLEAKCN